MISTMPAWLGNLLEGTMGPRFSVTESGFIAGSVKKVRFRGPVSKMNLLPGGASVIRVSETEYRNYTIAFHDVKQETVDIIFHIHGQGVGSKYIDSLGKGDELHISHARGQKVYDQRAARYFVFGDETSIGLASSLQPLFVAHNQPFTNCFALRPENEGVPALAGLRNVTALRKESLSGIEEAMMELPVMRSGDLKNTRFILTGNARSVQLFRKGLKAMGVSNISSQGYWLEGKKGL